MISPAVKGVVCNADGRLVGYAYDIATGRPRARVFATPLDAPPDATPVRFDKLKAASLGHDIARNARYNEQREKLGSVLVRRGLITVPELVAPGRTVGD